MHWGPVDAYHRSLGAYGVTTGTDGRSDVNKVGGGSSLQDVHPDSALVWRDLATLHLTAEDYNDAIRASAKAAEPVVAPCDVLDRLLPPGAASCPLAYLGSLCTYASRPLARSHRLILPSGPPDSAMRPVGWTAMHPAPSPL